MVDKVDTVDTVDKMAEAGSSYSMKFQHVADNEYSPVGAIVTEATVELGGEDGDVFSVADTGERLSQVQALLGEDYLDLQEALDMCVIIPKMERLAVTGNSSVKDLNIAVLLTHFDYISPVFYYRGVALVAANRTHQAVQDFNMALKYRLDPTPTTDRRRVC